MLLPWVERIAGEYVTQEEAEVCVACVVGANDSADDVVNEVVDGRTCDNGNAARRACLGHSVLLIVVLGKRRTPGPDGHRVIGLLRGLGLRPLRVQSLAVGA